MVRSGATEGGTDGCRKTEAHGSETTTGYDAQLLGKLEVAATDHLVLTYVVYENSLIMSSFRYHVGHLAHKQRTLCRMDILLYYLLLFLLAVFLEGISPLTVNILVQQTGNGWQTLLAVTYHSHIGLDNLVNLSLVNIQVDNL